MLSLKDKRWGTLRGGYKVPFDPRPSFTQLGSKKSANRAWKVLWENLHHQGDVGEVSYASVPQLIRIHRESSEVGWNIYALVAIIELARTERKNPAIPNFLRHEYFQSIQKLTEIGAKQIFQTQDIDTVRAILSVTALSAGARTHARFLLNYSDERAFGP